MSNSSQLSLIFLLVILSCGKKLPTLENVDLKAWREDRNGCLGYRSTIVDDITQQIEKLKALSEMDLIELFGRPDVNQLLDRNQKIYAYYLEPGPACDNSKPEPRQLILRINAMGLAKETLIK